MRVFPATNLKSRGRRGSELVEGMLMLLPFFALVFLIIDTSYALFIKATLQYAVQAGATYATTGATGTSGQLAAIEQTVQTHSIGLLGQGSTPQIVCTPASAPGNVAGANNPASVVQVQANYQFSPLAPLFRSRCVITLTATAATILTVNPAPPPCQPAPPPPVCL